MITASHNPEEDNGVKLIDPRGEMLEESWETLATQLVNAENGMDVVETVEKISRDCRLDGGGIINARVSIGWDTRPSSRKLVDILKEGVESVGGVVQKHCLCTTPMLHYVVRCQNDPSYGIASMDGYFQKLSDAFKTIRESNDKSVSNYVSKVCLDGANGVGAVATKTLTCYLGHSLQLDIFNDNFDEGQLNYKCGADYVKIRQIPPDGLNVQPGVKYATLDGDGDRLLYFFLESGGEMRILDGDHIATLIATYLKDLLCSIDVKVHLGIVQTAYANGNSTNFIVDKLKIPVICTKTGVKHLQREAAKFDVGIYFEANGHGTVVFSDDFRKKAKELEAATTDARVKTLAAFVDLTNETVGDAISDFLVVETILREKGWNLKDWLENTYRDLPNLQTIVRVRDRNSIETTDAERKCVRPSGLQEAIDGEVGKFARGRAFVRPSGTENVVRVYAEAGNWEDARSLAYNVAQLVYDMTGGVGTAPKQQLQTDTL